MMKKKGGGQTAMQEPMLKGDDGSGMSAKGATGTNVAAFNAKLRNAAKQNNKLDQKIDGNGFGPPLPEKPGDTY